MALKKIVLDLETHPSFAPTVAKAVAGGEASAFALRATVDKSEDCLIFSLNVNNSLGGCAC